MTGFDIWNELGNIYFKVGAFDEAIDAYNKAIELDFRIGWLYSNLGFAYAHKGQYAEAILEYEKSIELFNTDEDKAVSWGRLGEAYQQLHQYDQAIFAYQNAIALAPEDVSYNAGLNAVQDELSQLDQAVPQPTIGTTPADGAEVLDALIPVQDAAPALDDDDEESESGFMPGDDDGSVDLAVGAVARLFEEEIIPDAVANVPVDAPLQADEASDDEPLEEIANPAVMQITGEVPSPEPEIVVDEPLPAEAQCNVESPLDELVEGALDATACAVEMVTDQAQPVGQDEPAPDKSSTTATLEQDELETTNVSSLLSSGIELWRKGDHEKASQTLQAALEAAGKAENKWLEALSHNAMALVKTELGKLEEAIASYTQAMQLAPEKIVPWNNIGYLYSKLDRTDEAMQAFLKAIEHNPEDFVSWDGLGDIYAKLGRLNDSIAAYQLGNVFGKQRRVEDALTAYQMILEPAGENLGESAPVEQPAENVWVPEDLAVEALVAVEVEPVLVAVAEEPVAEEIVSAVTEELAVEAPVAVEVEPVLVTVAEEPVAEEIVSAVTEELAVEAPVAVEVEPVLVAVNEVEAPPVAVAEEPVAEEIVSAVSEEVAVEAPVAVEVEPVLVAADEVEAQPVAVAEEPLAEEIVSAVSEELAVEAPVSVEVEPVLVTVAEEPVAEEIVSAVSEEAAVEVPVAVEVEPVLVAVDEVEAQPVAVAEEPVAEEIVPTVTEEVAAEQPVAAVASLVTNVETSQPVMDAIAVDEPVSTSTIIDEVRVEDIVVLTGEGTVVEEIVVEETITVVGETVLAEAVSSVAEPVQAGLSERPGSAGEAESSEGPIAIEHDIISVDMPPLDVQPVQMANDVEEPAAAPQISVPELVGESVAVAEGAAVQTQAEGILENTSSSIELTRLASAIAAYKKVTEINPENDRAWDSLGNLYRASERYGDATLAFAQAISLRPDKEVYHYHLGLVYAAEKNYEAAIGAFQKVIELNPDYTFAHCALAGYFRKLGKEAEAQEHIDRALPKMTSEKEYDRACFAAICGNVDEAIELLKIALDKKQTSLDWVRRDPDLDFIRDDKRFKALISSNGSWSERLSDVFTKQLTWSPNK